MKKGVVALLILLCIGLGAGFFAINYMADREGPEITFGDANIVYKDNMNKEKLLKDVQAIDKKDGDVSDSLVVDSVYTDEEAGVATVVYVARDTHNNVSKIQRKIEYHASSKAHGEDSDEDEDKKEEKEDAAESEDDSDVQDKPEQEENTPDKEEEVSKELTDEEKFEKENEEKIAALPAGAPKVYLTQYAVKIKPGEAFDPLSYVKEIADDADEAFALWRVIQIQGDYDVNTPGNYELNYYVVDSSQNQSNVAVLRLVVE